MNIPKTISDDVVTATFYFQVPSHGKWVITRNRGYERG